MKTYVMLFGLLVTSSVSSADSSIQQPTPLFAACLANQTEPRLVPNRRHCPCVVRTLNRALEGEENSKAQLEWTRQVFDASLDPAEFKRDPFDLVEYINGVLDACKTSTSRR